MTVLSVAEKKKTIYVIHENAVWMEPLRQAFQEQGVDFEEWNFGVGGQVDLTSAPPEGVFYSRMSASSHTRGHRYAIEYTQTVLEWLELHNRRIVNGSRALLLEQNKVRQYLSLEAYKIKTPKTVVVTGNFNDNREDFTSRLISTATQHFDGVPFISKSNRGGRGIGVRLWKDVSYFQKYLRDEFHKELPVDGTLLLQQYIRPPQPFIVRCEFIGGKFLYAVKVNTSEGFELCPADHCSQIQNFKTSFEVTDEYDRHPIIAQYERFLRGNEIGICGIEFVVDEDGEFWTVDVNTNTNYNLAAEQVAFGEMKAMHEIVKYLNGELTNVEVDPPMTSKKITEAGQPARQFQTLRCLQAWKQAPGSTFSKTLRGLTSGWELLLDWYYDRYC
eukprot:TRINITY_DN1152_c0_g1_i2.p2 TRINITY_DN1152_c0_g1~~TRINITY_DN1152_c0_g1_i2.p2  ORF type:complete len:388 (-),score=87.26 TRINITY_DN1152_c0_g1_i2:1369-2532(-)